ncbi:TPA: restriction endonuclease subunit S [Enterococcus faecium]|nr:restriction endonuclease subunit S [Enterococcus faecalis]EIW9708343.1 restriction endonuclease subunit S [Enterococcus faecalis]
MKYSIKEIADINRNSLKKEELKKIVYLDTANLTKNKINELVDYDTKTDKVPSRAKRKVEDNDILISTVRPNQEHYGILKNTPDNLIVSTGFAVITPKSDLVDPYYLYAVLTQKKITNYLQVVAENSTSAYPSIKPSVIANLEIDLLTLNKQKSIGKFFKSLEYKIELNNQIISNLEELASTLFKRWFVDFEFPDENGNPYKSSGGKMLDSELGEIPEGWRLSRIGEEVQIVRGASPRPIQEFMSDSSGRPWVKISDANSASSCFINSTKQFIIDKGISRSRTVEPGTLILSNSATPGIPKFMDILASVHDGWLIFNEYRSFSKEFLYLLLLNKRKSILSLSNGSVFRNLKTDILKKFPVVVPDEIPLRKAQILYENIFKSILHHSREITTLEQLRDSLLPKLLSGEIELLEDEEV